LMEQASGVKKSLDEAKADHELLSSIATLDGDIGVVDQSKVQKFGESGSKDEGSLGERFVGADGWKNWLKTYGDQDGRIPDGMKGFRSPAIQFKGVKDLITGSSATSAGAITQNDRLAGVQELGRRPTVMRDLVTAGTTDSDMVEYVKITSETNNAAPVAEATATSGGSGVKPESAFALALATTAVRTIAHWIPASRRALSDAAQIRTLIDSFLRDGLEQELEDQMVNGDGTGENFMGIANESGVQAQAYATNLLVTTRKARTLVRTVGRRIPTAYMLNPTDWETIQLLRDDSGGAGTGGFLFGGPAGTQAETLWGLRVVESEAVTAGVGYVGDFRRAVLWDRERAQILVSDSHSDFFIRNMVAILAEMRAAFAVLQPNAFVEIDLTA
jgi:HK97 family phage major capsid protein